MPKSSKTKQPKVTMNIQSGPMTPAQKQAWKRFWQKVITEVKTGER